jgi:hypothetical protein
MSANLIDLDTVVGTLDDLITDEGDNTVLHGGGFTDRGEADSPIGALLLELVPGIKPLEIGYDNDPTKLFSRDAREFVGNVIVHAQSGATWRQAFNATFETWFAAPHELAA